MANPHDTRRPAGEDGDRSATDDLAARIARARAERPGRKPPADVGPGVTGASRAFRLASEFVAAIIVGAGLGYGIDLIAGTRPWATVILLLIGFAAGILNVVRSAAEMNAAVPPGTAAVDDEDDD